MYKLLLVFCLALFALPVLTQDGDLVPLGECDQGQYDLAVDILNQLASELEAGEPTQESYIAVSVVIGTLRAFCDGYVFTSEGYGLDTVTDPMTFRDGYYRAIIQSEEYVHIRLNELTGDCGIVPSIANSSDGGESQELWLFQNCAGIFDIDARTDWTLRLEPILQD